MFNVSRTSFTYIVLHTFFQVTNVFFWKEISGLKMSENLIIITITRYSVSGRVVIPLYITYPCVHRAQVFLVFIYGVSVSHEYLLF